MSEKELILTDCNWDYNDELKLSPYNSDWINEYGNANVLEVEAINKKFNESIIINLHLEDMIKLHKFLGEKLEYIKSSGIYDEFFK